MADPLQPLSLNGAYGEGGGALFRTALAMSALTQRPVHITDVRGAMRKPGLAAEDLAVLRALADSTQAQCLGDEVGANEVVFRPARDLRGLKQRFDIAASQKGVVAGNALIVLESILPALARSGMVSQLTVLGETHNSRALSFEAFDRSTLHAHRAQGIYAFPCLNVAGFGYGARGEVTLEIEPSALEPIVWEERGELIACRAVVTTGDLADEVAERGAKQISKRFKEIGVDVDVELSRVRARSPGAHVTVFAEYESGMGSGGAAGQRGLRIERVADNAFEQFLEWFESEATVDPFLADQLLIPAALCPEPSVFTTSRITKRLTTMAWVIKQFLPIHLTVRGHEGLPGKVTVRP